MEDYEYYSVDPNEYFTEETLALGALATAEIEAVRERRKKLFTPTHKATIPGLLLPLDAFILGDAVFTRCRSVADLEATLLKR